MYKNGTAQHYQTLKSKTVTTEGFIQGFQRNFPENLDFQEQIHGKSNILLYDAQKPKTDFPKSEPHQK